MSNLILKVLSVTKACLSLVSAIDVIVEDESIIITVDFELCILETWEMEVRAYVCTWMATYISFLPLR